MIHAISPIDGRYANKTAELQSYFSEAALIRYRVLVEIRYFLFLSEIDIIDLSDDDKVKLESIIDDFDHEDAQSIQDIEKTTNHDVKAVEYYIKDKITKTGLASDHIEYIHFGLTSQDINNTAMPMMLRDAIHTQILPLIQQVAALISQLATDYKGVSLLSRTHGQAASPTTMGKEMMVFADRLQKQINRLSQHNYEAKFGGATGNFNAHIAAYPHIDWAKMIDRFINSFGLNRQQYTTQIDQYDNFAEVFHISIRICTILIDFCRDMWTYVSRDFFKQKVIAGEVGSSAMPHKVNPIDFENAEGNLQFAIAILEFLARKLPVSRLQRDLTDSTVTRNIGVPYAHILVALKSLLKGIGKLEINHQAIYEDLESAWPVISEAIQTILRREGYDQPYEALKAFSRGKGKLTRTDFQEFISTLRVSEEIKEELRQWTPHNYLGDSAIHR